MLLYLPEISAPSLDYPSKFPRTPIWAKKIQDWREKGIFEDIDLDAFGSYSSCLIGEVLGFDVYNIIHDDNTRFQTRCFINYYLEVAFGSNNPELAEDALMLAQFL